MTTDPFALFDRWLADAEGSEPNDPNAMALATVGADGMPSVRMVLLKGRDAGFVFYTYGESRKADELGATAKAALLFHWKSLRKQVRIEGAVAISRFLARFPDYALAGEPVRGGRVHIRGFLSVPCTVS